MIEGLLHVAMVIRSVAQKEKVDEREGGRGRKSENKRCLSKTQ